MRHLDACSEKHGVCLQINVAPSDIRYAVHTIPHHMRVLGGQVTEVQFTLDTRQRRTTKFRSTDFDDALKRLRTLLEDVCATYPYAHITEVNFSDASVREIEKRLLIDGGIPISAYSGSLFYGYIFGINEVKSKYVLHIDADMLFGGGSQTWVEEAISVLEANNQNFAINPLGGPPTANGDIRQSYVERLRTPYPAFRFKTISTRIFLAERDRLLFRYPIPLMKVRGRRRLQAWINNVSPVYEFEVSLSELMVRQNLSRIDMLGTEAGLWSLHPVYRSETFYEALPSLIRSIEQNDVPEAQRGDYDLNDSMIDWSDARRRNGLGAKLLRYCSYAKNGFVERCLGRS